MALLGVHCSVAGGLENAFVEARLKNIDTFQIFSRNQRQWKAKPVTVEEQERFLAARKESAVKIIFSHCSYLLNLASSDQSARIISIAALTEEVTRCTQLGLSFCVLHPGAAGTQTKEVAMHNIAHGLKQVLENTPGSSVIILLENTAGQGSSVGGPFENLRFIHDLVGSKRIGYCFDTCHAFSAGYDISSEAGIKKTMKHFDTICGFDHLKAFHLNDSKGGLGSHLDRHENIGKGKLGLIPFRHIMHHFKNVPKVLETPKEDEMDYTNLKLLRSL
jgi:deoxyribonuclease-4